ncbi:MAG: universal stress protein, partial [Chloroflexi bacterium]|nr:universal stress protein [Chloroflexota bacterium]
MIRSILLPLDGSRPSAAACEWGLALAERFQAPIEGIHVYAAQLHGERFQEMEPGLPLRYQAPDELNRLRDTHDLIIGGGLKLISDAYLEGFRSRAVGLGLTFSTSTPEGRNYVEILRAAERGRHDLIALGALGLGQVASSAVGGVAGRVARHFGGHVLVARHSVLPPQGPVVVGVDGSATAYHAVKQAVALAKAFGGAVEAVAVFDPY